MQLKERERIVQEWLNGPLKRKYYSSDGISPCFGFTLIARHEEWENEIVLQCDRCCDIFAITNNKEWINSELRPHLYKCISVSLLGCMPTEFVFQDKL